MIWGFLSSEIKLRKLSEIVTFDDIFKIIDKIRVVNMVSPLNRESLEITRTVTVRVVLVIKILEDKPPCLFENG